MKDFNSNERQIAYSQMIWEITSALQEDASLENALRSSLNKTIKFIGAEAGTIWYFFYYEFSYCFINFIKYSF